MADDLAEICGIGSANAYLYITRPKQVYKLIFWTVSGQPSGLHIKRVRSHKMDWKNEGVILQLAELASKGLSSKEIATELSETYNEKVGDRSVRRVANSNGIELKQSNRNGYTPERHVETERHADGTINNSKPIEMSEAQAMDDNFVMKAHGFDPEKWQVVNIKNSFWEQNSREDGKTKLYSSKITVKPKENASIEAIIKQLTTDVKPYNIENKRVESKNNMVLPLADMHFGITKIADLDEHLATMKPILQKGYDIFVIEQLGDLFHSSQMWSSQTMRGTILDEVDMVTAIQDAQLFFDFLIRNINANKIIIKQMGGNHSQNEEYMFMEYLKAKYPTVQIDNNIKYRDAYLLGNIGILIAHGDFAKKGLVSLFPNEFKKIWGLSSQAYIHTGHFHTQKTTDEGGVLWQQFGTIKPNDKYEISNGWTMSKKTMYLMEYTPDALLAEYYV